jgi:hypothetical protein
MDGTRAGAPVGAYGAEDFDWSVLEIPTAQAMLRGQLDFSWHLLRDRLATVGPAEFRWEPVPGALSVVTRGAERSTRTLGTGQWVAEWPAGHDDPTPRTIAWLVAHLTEVFFERWEWTFGPRERRREDVEVHGEPGPALEELGRWVDAWRSGVEGLAAEEVFSVGLSRATPLDASAPFGHVVQHLNRELIHHGAEIMSLTDLYRASHGR